MSHSEADVKKIMSGASPDVIEIDIKNGAKSIGVDTVRDEIKARAFLVPNDLEYKLFIIKNADKMTVAAQNALLKLIEEPPEETYFVLIASSGIKLLPTVRSRSVTLRMEVFKSEAIVAYLKSHTLLPSGMDDDELSKIALLADGSIGEAIRLISDRESHKDSGGRARLFLKAYSERDKISLYEAISSLPSERVAFEGAINALRMLVRDEIVYLYDESAERLTDNGNGISLSAEKLFSLERLLSEVEKDLFSNPNIQSVKNYIFARLIH